MINTTNHLIFSGESQFFRPFGMDKDHLQIPFSTHFPRLGAIINPRYNTKKMISKTNIEELEQFKTDEKTSEFLRPKPSGGFTGFSIRNGQLSSELKEEIFAARLDDFFEDIKHSNFHSPDKGLALSPPSIRRSKSCSALNDMKLPSIEGNYSSTRVQRCHSDVIEGSVHGLKNVSALSDLKNVSTSSTIHNANSHIPDLKLGKAKLPVRSDIIENRKLQHEKNCQPLTVSGTENVHCTNDQSIKDKYLRKCSKTKLRVSRHINADITNLPAEFGNHKITGIGKQEGVDVETVPKTTANSTNKKRKWSDSPNLQRCSQTVIMQPTNSKMDQYTFRDSDQNTSNAQRSSYNDDIVSFVVAKNRLLADNGEAEIDLKKLSSLSDMEKPNVEKIKEKGNSSKVSGIFKHYFSKSSNYNNHPAEMNSFVESSPEYTQSNKSLATIASTCSQGQDFVKIKETGIKSPFESQIKKFLKKTSNLIKSFAESTSDKDDIYFNFGPILKPELEQDPKFLTSLDPFSQNNEKMHENFSNGLLQLQGQTNVINYPKRGMKRKISFNSFIKSESATDTIMYFKEYVNLVF
ncbi:uncharacterized protein KGF55_002521 [Candida pseudojiufengensis]|uniref:uncharacterized protein n=1 Tax=Candida pseudojiufengensis TaxID=497109 RepID=UPI0022248345|nr:uncharacterized protein KGF55_002521 [Candida pseudojiufengensis]KAI5963641.1 hypothetical protein KGF55_002521 [Candida pseudojiufengensis]